MKTKNITTGWKFLLLSLIAVLVTFGLLGTSSIFADPTLNDLIEEKHYGSFVPNRFVQVEDLEGGVTIPYTLKNTELIVNVDCWTDVNGNGVISTEDIYSIDGYNEMMLQYVNIHPLIEYSSSANAYAVYLGDMVYTNSVLVDVKLSKNNNFAQLVDESMYFFDETTNYLYINKSVYDSYADGVLGQSPFRIQTIYATKNIKELTKDVVVATGFADTIIDNPIKDIVPNKVITANMYDWETSNVTIQVVPETYASYISKDNLYICINGEVVSNDIYNEATGCLNLANVEVFSISDILIYIDKLNDVSANSLIMQHIQDFNNDSTALASMGWSDVPDYKGLMLKYETDPKDIVGEQSEDNFVGLLTFSYNINSANEYVLGDANSSSIIEQFFTYVGYGNSQNVTTQKINEAFGWLHGQKFNGSVGAMYKTEGDAIYGYNITDVNVQKAFANIATNAVILRKVKYNPSSTEAQTQAALAELNKEIETAFGKCTVSTNTNVTKNLTTSGTRSVAPKMYVVGPNISASINESHQNAVFFGGKVLSGFPYFLGTCCEIESSDVGSLPDSDVHTGTDFSTNITVVKQDMVDAEGGYLYLAVTPKTISGNTAAHTQRIITFMKIPYIYSGTGKIILEKVDYENENIRIGGAKYVIEPEIIDSNIPVQTTHIITSSEASVESIELPYGVYTIKEVPNEDLNGFPVGYLYNEVKWTVEVRQREVYQRTYDVGQKVELEMIVYDRDTVDDKTPRPINGLQFELINQYTQEKVPFAHYVQGQWVGCSYTDSRIKPTQFIGLKNGPYKLPESSLKYIATTGEGNVDKNDHRYDGVISLRFEPGVYTLRQLNSVELYYRDTHSPIYTEKYSTSYKTHKLMYDSAKNEYYNQYNIVVDSGSYKKSDDYESNCVGGIGFVALPDNTGQNIKKLLARDNNGMVIGTGTGVLHTEPRQRVILNSQVRDLSLDADTPADFGIDEDEAGYVATKNAGFFLYCNTDINIKNEMPNPIIIPANTRLNVCDSVGNLYSTDPNYYGAAISKKSSDGKAYVTAQYINYEGKVYELPNGEYRWELVKPSPGFILRTGPNDLKSSYEQKYNLDSSNGFKINYDDTCWVGGELKDTRYRRGNFEGEVGVNEPVYEKRQTVEINSFSKSYGSAPTIETKNYVFQSTVTPYELGTRPLVRYTNNFDISLNNKIESSSGHPLSMGDSNSKGKITYRSTESHIISDNNETYKIVNPGNSYLPNCVYVLKNKSEIVPISGRDNSSSTISGTIPANTVLCYFIADEKGEALVKYINSPALENPNLHSEIGQENKTPEVSVLTIKNGNSYKTCHITSANENSFTDWEKYLNSLPNGDYIIECFCPADGYDVEEFFEYVPTLTIENNKIVSDLGWTLEKTKNGDAIVEKLSGDYLTVYRYEYKPEPDFQKGHMQIAPDPIDRTPSDPYDPDNPDDTDNPDDSDDIPYASGTTDKEQIDWIKAHCKDVSYRIVDMENMSSDTDHDVVDTLPTTFSFCAYDKVDLYWITKVRYSFYYELTKDEFKTQYYDSETGKSGITDEEIEAMIASSEYSFDNKDKEFFIYVEKNSDSGNKVYYMRRFSTTTQVGSQGCKWLEDTITINKESNGCYLYDNGEKTSIKLSEGFISPNTAISGAITDIDWLNERMLIPEFNGQYHIFVGGDYTRTNSNVPDHDTTLVKSERAYELGKLTIAVRQLVDLD